MPEEEITDEEEEEILERHEEEQIIKKWEEAHPEQEVQETEPITEEQKQAWIDEAEKEEFQERKKALLEKLEKQIEESGKQDAQERKEITDLKKQLIDQTKLNQFWQTVLANPLWEQILRDYFRKIYGMTKGMCAKTVITISEKDGEMTFISEFFDSNGNPITTEFNDEAKKAMEEDAKQ